VQHPRLQQLLALPDGDTYLEAVALLHEALLYGYNQAQLAAAAAVAAAGQHTGTSSSRSKEAQNPAEAAAEAAGDKGSSSSRTADQQGLGSYLATLPVSVPLPVFAGGR
jgi:hypothetical protein